MDRMAKRKRGQRGFGQTCGDPVRLMRDVRLKGRTLPKGDLCYVVSDPKLVRHMDPGQIAVLCECDPLFIPVVLEKRGVRYGTEPLPGHAMTPCRRPIRF